MQYFIELKELFKNEKISKDTFLQTATSFLIHENISAERKQTSSQQQSSGNEATEKQILYLQKEKIKIPEEGFTKSEASQLISEIIERKKQSKSKEQYQGEGSYNY